MASVFDARSGARLYEGPTLPAQLVQIAQQDAERVRQESKPMGFFDDIVSGIGDVAKAAGGIVRAIPGAQFTPIGAAATAAGDFASGGFAGLTGNLLGRATALAPLVGTALGAPQL